MVAFIVLLALLMVIWAFLQVWILRLRYFISRKQQLLRESELSRKNYECKPIALGINTDSYQPAEKDLKITRSLLEVLYEFNHPVSIVTKSSRILRDLDILSPHGR